MLSEAKEACGEEVRQGVFNWIFTNLCSFLLRASSTLHAEKRGSTYPCQIGHDQAKGGFFEVRVVTNPFLVRL